MSCHNGGRERNSSRPGPAGVNTRRLISVTGRLNPAFVGQDAIDVDTQPDHSQATLRLEAVLLDDAGELSARELFSGRPLVIDDEGPTVGDLGRISRNDAGFGGHRVN